ncbi:MAG: glycosyltransferase [Patescibacteria group bacterium]|nr:glycosyltransferase [Patescibacteria group bacterium]
MKVLYLDQGDFIGGAEIFSILVLNELKKKKYLTKVIVGTNSAKSEYALKISKIGLKSVKTPLPKLPPFHIVAFIQAVWKLARLIKKEKPDIVHTNTNRAHLIASTALYFSKKPKLTWMLHDFDFHPWFVKKCHKSATKIGALPAVLASIEKIIQPKKDKLLPIVNGVDLMSVKKANPLKFEKEFKLAKNSFRIAIIGRITKWKGIEIFIRAALIIIPRFSRAEFFIVGTAQPQDLSFEKKMKKICEESKYGKKIHWLGWRNDNLDIISALDILINASINPEPFGRTIIEAMALGVTVIATSHGGPRQIIKNNENGMLIPPRNPAYLAAAIEKLIDDSNLRAKLTQAGRKEVAEKYTLAKVAASLKNLWGEALK